MNLKRASKFLSLILRHKPETIGVVLDEEGWADVNLLLAGMQANGWPDFHLDELEEVVATNNKKRFAFNEDKTKIRASQGHSSIEVNLGLKPVKPLDRLYHGTVAKFLKGIKEQGLARRSRQHVHLSGDIETARNVGSRRGKPIILTVLAKEMAADGYNFYLSDNGVWLVDEVPLQYIQFPG